MAWTEESKTVPESPWPEESNSIPRWSEQFRTTNGQNINNLEYSPFDVARIDFSSTFKDAKIYGYPGKTAIPLAHWMTPGRENNLKYHSKLRVDILYGATLNIDFGSVLDTTPGSEEKTADWWKIIDYSTSGGAVGDVIIDKEWTHSSDTLAVGSGISTITYCANIPRAQGAWNTFDVPWNTWVPYDDIESFWQPET